MFKLENFLTHPIHAHTALAARGDTALAAPCPTISATDYLDFFRNGLRIPFENKYFGRRHLLNDLVMAECATQDGKYIDAIANAVWAICEESGWQLPPHNSYGRGGPNLPLPDPTRPVIELFSCETGAQLALVLHLLGDRLEAAAPGITARVLAELTHRVVTPYLTEHFWWMGNGEEQMCNWTPWCTQNVLLVAALTPQTVETRKQICEKAEHSLHCFLKDYGEDGCCDEGAKYYGHAALCLFASIEVLNELTNGQYMSWYEDTKIRNIADFIRQMHVAGDYYINFADCPPKLPPPNALVCLFGKRTENISLMAFAADGIRRHGLYKPSEDLSLYTRLVEFFTSEEIAECTTIPTLPQDIYYPSAGVFIARDARTCLAVKAGHNADNHNHNDTGSITLYFDGKPFFIDVGVGSYTRDTFSNRRYTIWTMQSAYHNLPTFGGIMQNAGRKFQAMNVKYDIGDTESQISMDIAAAYPPEAGVTRYRRTVRLVKGEAVYVTDEYEGMHPAELSLMLDIKPAISGDIVEVPSKGSIYVTGANDIALEEIAVTDPLLQKSWGEKLYRLVVTFKGKLELKVLPF